MTSLIGRGADREACSGGRRRRKKKEKMFQDERAAGRYDLARQTRNVVMEEGKREARMSVVEILEDQNR